MIFIPYKKGFTLIELLVVISIIGLLSSVVLASLNVTRSKARDAKRLSDVRQIQNALELYRSNNAAYPPIVSGLRENSCWDGLTNTSVPAGGWTTTLSGLVSSNLISSLPLDPKNTGTVGAYPYYCYAYVPSSASVYGSCVDIATGVYQPLSNYEYAIYLNLENTPTKGSVIHWQGTPGNETVPISWSAKPYNYCVLGPGK